MTNDLTFADLKRAAALARISGLCYASGRSRVSDGISALGGTLVEVGQGPHTSWIVADCPLPAPGQQAVDNRLERVVVFRGVVWARQDVDALQVWRRVSDFIPESFLPERTRPTASVVAHRGISRILDEVWPEIARHVVPSPSSPPHVTFAGHSLGGALALMATARSRLEAGAADPSCHTFGSPPVLAHDKGGGSAPLLEALGLTETAVTSFVLENDPVPRAFLHVDPVYRALITAAPVIGQLLALRQRVFGDGVALSPKRFLYEMGGRVFLVRWSVERGHTITRVSGVDGVAADSLDLGGSLSSAVELLQAILVRPVTLLKTLP